MVANARVGAGTILPVERRMIMIRVRTSRFLHCLMACALFIPAVAVAEGGLLTGIPAPADSESLGTGTVSSGGEKASYSTSANPNAVIESYKQSLAGAGWK